MIHDAFNNLIPDTVKWRAAMDKTEVFTDVQGRVIFQNENHGFYAIYDNQHMYLKMPRQQVISDLESIDSALTMFNRLIRI